MSRVLISTLAFGAASLLSTTSHAQPLNINPYPMQKAGTLSVQEPQVVTPEPVEVFAKEAEEDIIRLEREKEALAAERERAEKVRRDAQARALELTQEKERLSAMERAANEEAVRLQREYEALAAEREAQLAAERERSQALEAQAKAEAARLQQEKELEFERAQAIEAQAKADTLRLQKEKAELEQALAARAEKDAAQAQALAQDMERLKVENEILSEKLKQREVAEAAQALEKQKMQEALKIKQQREDAAALERENAILAAKLEAQRLEDERIAAVQAENEAKAREQAQVEALKEQNIELAQKLKAIEEEKRKQAELALAKDALDQQTKTKSQAALDGLNDADVLLETEISNVDPLFESASAENNPVGMTPLPSSEDGEVLEVRASDLGLVKSNAVILNDETQVKPVEPSRERKVSRQVDHEAAGLTVIPYPVQQNMQGANPSASIQRHAPSQASAQAGESLEDVLRSWSRAEGVGFLWKTTQNFNLQAPISMNGNYAASVEALLAQYDGDAIRPVGKLTTDPVTGTRILSILTE